jgi:hypothetical protein
MAAAANGAAFWDVGIHAFSCGAEKHMLFVIKSIKLS